VNNRILNQSLLYPLGVIVTKYFLKISNLKKYYPLQSGFMRKTIGWLKALDDVSLTINAGETIGIVGESGCGKTTFGKTLMMLQRPTSGNCFSNFLTVCAILLR